MLEESEQAVNGYLEKVGTLAVSIERLEVQVDTLHREKSQLQTTIDIQNCSLCITYQIL